MAFVVKDRTKESTSTTGTGSITLSGAASNYQTFNTAVGVGNFTWYCINHLSANEWEVGYGQLTGATTFARTSVLASTNSNALVSFSAGTKEIFVTQPAAFNNQTLGRTNMIVNPHGGIQQETTSFLTVTAGVYFADQWLAAKVSSTGVLQAGSFTGTVSAYDPFYMFLKTTTAQAVLAAGDFAVFLTYIEGLNFRRMGYGAAGAKGSWLRFRASCTQSATASVSIRNGATSNRSFVQSFAVTTTPTDYAIFVPGDTTGTWAVDNTASASVTFAHSVGTTFQTSTLGSWQAGTFYGANTQTNLMATLNAELRVTDVQWSASDVLLPFEPIEYLQELQKCQRFYYQSSPVSAQSTGWMGQAIGTTAAIINLRHPVQMRAAPTVSVTSMGVTNSTAGVINVTSGSLTNSTVDGAAVQVNVAAGLVAGNACWLTGAGTVAFSSRM